MTTEQLGTLKSSLIFRAAEHAKISSPVNDWNCSMVTIPRTTYPKFREHLKLALKRDDLKTYLSLSPCT